MNDVSVEIECFVWRSNLHQIIDQDIICFGGNMDDMSEVLAGVELSVQTNVKI